MTGDWRSFMQVFGGLEWSNRCVSDWLCVYRRESRLLHMISLLSVSLSLSVSVSLCVCVYEREKEREREQALSCEIADAFI